MCAEDGSCCDWNLHRSTRLLMSRCSCMSIVGCICTCFFAVQSAARQSTRTGWALCRVDERSVFFRKRRSAAETLNLQLRFHPQAQWVALICPQAWALSCSMLSPRTVFGFGNIPSTLPCISAAELESTVPLHATRSSDPHRTTRSPKRVVFDVHYKHFFFGDCRLSSVARRFRDDRGDRKSVV